MRIRKRKVPLPLSLLSPIPLSDPHLFSRSSVMVVKDGVTTPTPTPVGGGAIYSTHEYDNTEQFYSQPSDHLTVTCPGTSASDLRRLIVGSNTSTVTGFEEGEGVQTSNDDDASNANITTTTTAAAAAALGAAVAADDNNDRRPLLSNNNEEVGRWCDGDKAIPLKKRRGINFNSFVENSSTMIDDEEEEDMAMATTMIMMSRSNNTNKCDLKNYTEDNVNNNKDVVMSNDTGKDVAVVASTKKGNSKRGNTIMEGSRCSRVNGRGWRCCQPTLVGYSLCEHHLGKGRLRSMASSNSAKARSSKKKSNTNNAADSAKKVETMSSFGNKRVKLGVVKARSLSSLLGQTTNTMNNIVGDHAHMQQYEKINNNLDYQCDI